MAHKYKNIKELIEELKEFHDIEFEYNAVQYSICPINGIYAVGGGNIECEYDTIGDLVNNLKIQGQLLKNIIAEIDVYLH